MRISSAIRTALIALVAFVGSAPASHGDSGFVTLTIYKAGWFIGGSGGSGILDFHGRYFPLSRGMNAAHKLGDGLGDGVL